MKVFIFLKVARPRISAGAQLLPHFGTVSISAERVSYYKIFCGAAKVFVFGKTCAIIIL